MRSLWLGLCVLIGCASAAIAGPVQDCQPCAFKAAANAPDLSLLFQLRSRADGTRVVEEIIVQQAGQELQRLKAPGMESVFPNETFLLDEPDLNFDGYHDLALATARGAANTVAMYWLFDPSNNRFTPLGSYPWLTVDTARKRLTSYERGGDGGLIYTATEYMFDKNALMVMRRERQERQPRGGYRKIIEERRNGKLQIVQRQKVKPLR